VRSRARPAALPAASLAALILLFLPTAAFAQADVESYRLRADRLEGSLNGAENVYTAIRPILTHGTTTVTGDSALVYRTREFVFFRGHVKIVDSTTTMWGDEASYERKDRRATLRGNVRIEERGSRITGREATFYRDKNLSVITGSPRMVDSTRTLTADRIEYDRNNDVVLALGHVDALDQADSTRVLAGRVRYDRRANYAWADMSPRLDLTEAGGVVTHVSGDSLEFDREKDQVFARGNVRVEREKLQATAGRAAFFRRENRAILVDSPRAWDPEGSASGDTLEIRLVQNRVASMQAHPHAKVAYEAHADSTRAERTTATGDTITLFLENDAARRALIVGHASSFYWPSSVDSARGGRNESTGDTIIVEFDKGKPAHATVLGSAVGTYYMAAEGDTAAAARRERIVYRGREIGYDLRRNSVDILGTADVAYREMRLKANQVHFDADTEKMRAEGKPVLEDAGDRIVGQTMTYDLRIRRGAVMAGRTKYEQGYVTGDRVLRVSENILDVKNGTYTTCDLPDPHYHFGAGKMRILLHDKAVAKPVVFYIKHIPVMAIPFYVFPINSGRHSGFQLPQFEFGSSSAAGKFVRNVGYYWAINDHLDATGWGDYYQDASWIAHGQMRYHKRYAYQGDFSGSFQNLFGTPQTGGHSTQRWDLSGRHYQTLGLNSQLTADLNLTNSPTYLSDPSIGRSVLYRTERILSSNIGYSKNWSAAHLDAGFVRNHYLSPDPGGLRLLQQLPSVRFRLSARPIGRADRPGMPGHLRGLASVVYSYDTQLLSQRNVTVNRYATVADQRDSITDVRTGMVHSLTITDNRSILTAIRVSPTFSARGIYYSRDDSGARNRFGGNWNAGIGANTQIFGTMTHSIGPLRALRHVITPSVSFSYQPRIRNLTFVDTTGFARSRFAGIPTISLASAEYRVLTFGLRNDIHVKWGGREHPKTINNLISLGSVGTYDLLAKRQGRRPLSDISSSLTIRPIDRSEFDLGFVHDPYTGTLKTFTASTGLALTGVSKAASDSTLQMSDEPGEAAVREGNYLRPEGLTSTSLPWQVGLSIGYRGNRDEFPGSATFGRWSSQATMNGTLGLNLSRGWRFDYKAQYEMHTRTLVSQYFTVKRELHCWEAQFTRSISGDIKEYYFKINVKLLPEVYYEQGSRGLRGFGSVNNLY
jgi:lipopolysaccharide assembly outer membrane protein LptD (OstA)